MPEQNILGDFFKILWVAPKEKRRSSEKREHWLDYGTER